MHTVRGAHLGSLTAVEAERCATAGDRIALVAVERSSISCSGQEVVCINLPGREPSSPSDQSPSIGADYGMI